MTILIIGATGIIGSRVTREADQPRRRRPSCRAQPISRRLSTRCKRHRHCRPGRNAAVRLAFEGIERAVLITANSPNQLRQERNVIDAARHSGVRHLGKLSVGEQRQMHRLRWRVITGLRSCGCRAAASRPPSCAPDFHAEFAAVRVLDRCQRGLEPSPRGRSNSNGPSGRRGAGDRRRGRR